MKNEPWVIIQAGGLGTRMKHLTTNRPKCLVPVGTNTILSNAINIFGDKTIVIGDYLIDILKEYVNLLFPNVKVIKANSKGTCSGLKEAIKNVNDNEPIIFMWSDLFFEEMPIIDFTKTTIGLSRTFPCRYQYDDSLYTKIKDSKTGVAGFFCFPNSSYLKDVPDEGSFVGDYLKNSSFKFENHLWLDEVNEIGTLESLKEYESKKIKSRFFNEIIVGPNSIIKKVKDNRYLDLIQNEILWYSKIKSIKTFEEVPQVICENPFEIELRNGQHPYSLSLDERKNVLIKISLFLSKLHKQEISNVEISDLYQMYVQKPIDRTIKYSKLLKDFEKENLEINGTKCINPFYASSFEKIFKKIKCNNFCLIHGDLTFSNCLWDSSNNKLSVFDPRGVFGNSKIVGDPAYDWSKVYYSSVDCYDLTNTRNFQIKKDNDKWEISNINKEMDDVFWKICPFDKEQILIRLSLIWFSLIGYLENDIDAMNFAFLKGCLSLYHSKND